MNASAESSGGSNHMYERLSDAESPTAGAAHRTQFQFPAYGDTYDSDDCEPCSGPGPGSEQKGWSRVASQLKGWARRLAGPQQPEHSPSAYLTLIPLSDERLKPRRTCLLISLILLLCAASMCAVFFLVARGVTVSAGSTTRALSCRACSH